MASSSKSVSIADPYRSFAGGTGTLKPPTSAPSVRCTDLSLSFLNLLLEDLDVKPLEKKPPPSIASITSRKSMISKDADPNSILPDEEGAVDIATEKYAWSPQAKDLKAIAKSQGRRTFPKADLFSHFKQLKLTQFGLKKMDWDTRLFTNLIDLNLSGNELSKLENVPQNLTALHALNNNISALDFSAVSVADSKPQPSNLLYLAIGYNSLESLRDLSRHSLWLCTLVSLDLSYNRLFNLSETAKALSPAYFPQLRLLWLQGNPFCILPNYRSSIINSCAQLLSLDDDRIEDEDRKSNGKNAIIPSTGASVSFSFSIRGILGVEMDPAFAAARSQYEEQLAAFQAAEKAKPAAKKGAPESAPLEPPVEPKDGRTFNVELRNPFTSLHDPSQAETQRTSPQEWTPDGIAVDFKYETQLEITSDLANVALRPIVLTVYETKSVTASSVSFSASPSLVVSSPLEASPAAAPSEPMEEKMVTNKMGEAFLSIADLFEGSSILEEELDIIVSSATVGGQSRPSSVAAPGSPSHSGRPRSPGPSLNFSAVMKPQQSQFARAAGKIRVVLEVEGGGSLKSSDTPRS